MPYKVIAPFFSRSLGRVVRSGEYRPPSDEAARDLIARGLIAPERSLANAAPAVEPVDAVQSGKPEPATVSADVAPVAKAKRRRKPGGAQ